MTFTTRASAPKARRRHYSVRYQARLDAETHAKLEELTKILNLTKAIPLIGGFLSGGIDATACYTVGKTAKTIFGAADDREEGEACASAP